MDSSIDRRDSAYNALVVTEKILQRMGAIGDVSSSRQMLGQARREYAAGNYELAVEYGTRARGLLPTADEGQIEETTTEPEEDGNNRMALDQITGGSSVLGDAKVKDISSEEVEVGGINMPNEEGKKGDEKDVEERVLKDLEREARSALENRDEHLPAKFTIRMARDAIERARRDEKDVEEAEILLEQASQAYDGKQYSQAFSLANRSKKMALGEAAEEPRVPSRGSHSPQKPSPPNLPCPECGCETMNGECQNCSVVVVEELVCGSCGGVVEKGSVFCRHCGSRLLMDECACPHCGVKSPGDSKFCPKCGARFKD